jgi:hypothetical protein
LLAGLLLGSLLTTTAARAAETEIGFDPPSVSAGQEVTNQYEAEGLRMGTSAALGGPPPAGACDAGSPITRDGSLGPPAASPPDFAALQTCFGAANRQGTYGALLGSPRGALAVDVRNLIAGSGEIEVRVIGYNATGEVVGEGIGVAGATKWERIAVTLNGTGKISFFAITTGIVTFQEIAIDNLTFESAPSTEPPPPTEPPPSKEPPPSTEPPRGTTTTPAPPAAPSPPDARGSLTTPNPTAGELLTLSGAGSSPGSGHIISYGWNFSGGEKVQTSTGTNPNAQVMLGAGAHTVVLTVTNSNGEKASQHFGVNVAKTSIHLPDGGEGECIPRLEFGDATVMAECIQKYQGNGYVIGGGEVQINGMTLKLKSGGPLKIRSRNDIGAGANVTELYGGQVDIELLNTPLGDMVLGGRDLEAEPLVLEFQSYIHALVPVFHSSRHARARVAEKPNKTLLMAFGVGKKCEPKEAKKAGCCPPTNGITECAELPGNFPLTGQVDVYLNNKGQALFDVQVGLSLTDVNFEATGALEIIANLETGIELSSLEFTIPEASLAPIFKVTKAKFVYYFPEYFEPSKRDSWQAKGIITFGEEIVELESELAFKHGEFQSAAMKFKSPHGGVPIYPGIFLNEIGASVGVNPLAFGGSLGASIADLLELEFDFKFREATSEQLGFFGGKGSLSLYDDEIASIAADVYSDGYVDAEVQLNIHFPLDSKSPVIEVRGGAGFWDEPASGLWQANGYVFFKLWIISAEIAGLVNNKYAAGCVHVGAEGIFGGGVQGRYRFSDGNISGGLFGNDNCSDQLKQYNETPLKEHKGGFVGEESMLSLTGNPLTAGAPVLTASRAHAAASEERKAFTLPGGTQGQELRISSPSGTPVVTLVSPDGQRYTTPATPGQLEMVAGHFMSAIAPDPHQVLVLLRSPRGGEWGIKLASGSAPISKVEIAEDVPPASVKIRVRRGHGKRWTLAYAVKHFVPGTKVMFAERGKDTGHVLGTVGKASGKLGFSPEEGLGRARKLYAYLVDAEGAIVRELSVGGYTAPAAYRPGRSRRVEILRHGNTAVIKWASVAGARVYRVRVTGSDGRLQSFITKAHSVVLANVLPFESFTATVTAAGGVNMLHGRPAKATLRAAPTRHRRSGKHHR